MFGYYHASATYNFLKLVNSTGFDILIKADYKTQLQQKISKILFTKCNLLLFLFSKLFNKKFSTMLNEENKRNI